MAETGRRSAELNTERLLAKIENAFAIAAGAGIVACTILGVAEIFGRSLLNWTIPGYIDVIEYLAAVFAFFGLAYCQRLGGHVRMDILVERLPRRGQHVSDLVDTLVGLAFVGILFTAAWSHFLRAYEFGDSSMDIQLPMWPSKLMVPVAFGLWWLRLLVQAIGYGLLTLRPGADTRFVPPHGHATSFEEVNPSDLGDAA